MYLSELRLFNFRNLGEQRLSFSPALNAIVGQNGQGKTNLIEAISILSSGKSFRTSKLQELLSLGHTSGSIYGTSVSQHGVTELGIILEGRSRKTFVDGKKTESIGDFFGRLLAISFAPSDLSLVKGLPQERRKFLDRHVVDLYPPVLEHYLAYYRALSHKNEILRGDNPSSNEINSWNIVLAKSALEIIKARTRVLEDLSPLAATFHQRFSSGDGELSLRLESSLVTDDIRIRGLEDIVSIFESYREREVARHGALIGPHRDDLNILLGATSARAFASQGQSRSIVLSLKLAVIELIRKLRGEEPIILLDDVDAELDGQRSKAFFEMLAEHKHQAFITGTDLQHLRKVWHSRPGKVLSIENGVVKPLEETAKM